MNSDNDAPDDLPAPTFPAERTLVSGHDAPYVSPQELDASTFREVEQIGQPWSWHRQRAAG